MELKEMMDGLIGSYLVELSEAGFTIKGKDGKEHHFVFEQDEGDCCGFNEISATLFFNPNDKKNLPAITNIDLLEDECADEGNSLRMTFFGLAKKLAMIESYSSSGSGWEYGATVTLVCKRQGPRLWLHRGKGGIRRESHQVQGGQQKPPQT